MATPTRSTRRIQLPGLVCELEVLTGSPAGSTPAVLLVGALGSAFGARAALRLARAGFTAVSCGAVGAAVSAAVAERLRTGAVEGLHPSSVGTVNLPLGMADGSEDQAIDALVRDLASRLT